MSKIRATDEPDLKQECAPQKLSSLINNIYRNLISILSLFNLFSTFNKDFSRGRSHSEQ